MGKSREGRKIELARGLLVAGKKAAALVMVVIDDCAWDQIGRASCRERVSTVV